MGTSRSRSAAPSISSGCGTPISSGSLNRESPRSTWTGGRLRMRKSATGVVTFPHLLVPIELSEQSSRTLRIVGTLPASRVTLLHVIHRVPGLRATEFRGFYARLRRRAEQVVERAANTLAASGLRVSQVVTIGDPAREIVRLAAARRGGLGGLRAHRIAPGPGQGLGTTSYKVAIACSCPVLLVK